MSSLNPSSLHLVRWGAIGFVLGGAVRVVLGLLIVRNPTVGPDPVLELHVIALLLLSMGLVGLDALQKGGYRRIGRVGFYTVLVAAAVRISGAVAILSERSTLAGLVYPVGYWGIIVGFVLYGAATLQRKVLPRWYGTALIIFEPASEVFTSSGHAWLGQILSALVLAVLGYGLWSRRNAAVEATPVGGYLGMAVRSRSEGTTVRGQLEGKTTLRFGLVGLGLGLSVAACIGTVTMVLTWSSTSDAPIRESLAEWAYSGEAPPVEVDNEPGSSANVRAEREEKADEMNEEVGRTAELGSEEMNEEAGRTAELDSATPATPATEWTIYSASPTPEGVTTPAVDTSPPMSTSEPEATPAAPAGEPTVNASVVSPSTPTTVEAPTLELPGPTVTTSQGAVAQRAVATAGGP